MYLREIAQIYRIKLLISIQLRNPGKDNDGLLVWNPNDTIVVLLPFDASPFLLVGSKLVR